MDNLLVIAFVVAIVVFFIGTLVVPYYRGRKKRKSATSNSETVQMQLQAYERLILLVDRIALPNLIPRITQPGFTAKEMQLYIINNIVQEYEYNITQQMYVSKDAWTAVKNLKEQNIGITNQIANLLPDTATGIDLCRVLAEFLLKDKRGTLHELVSEAVSFEAKKILK
jgi:heme/copper-type cytochrome/quinol oxidase subunit 2